MAGISVVVTDDRNRIQRRMPVRIKTASDDAHVAYGETDNVGLLAATGLVGGTRYRIEPLSAGGRVTHVHPVIPAFTAEAVLFGGSDGAPTEDSADFFYTSATNLLTLRGDLRLDNGAANEVAARLGPESALLGYAGAAADYSANALQGDLVLRTDDNPSRLVITNNDLAGNFPAVAIVDSRWNFVQDTVLHNDIELQGLNTVGNAERLLVIDASNVIRVGDADRSLRLHSVDDPLLNDLHTIWHSGNDGAGSGLDADTLDTLSSAAFSLAGHTHTHLSTTGQTVNDHHAQIHNLVDTTNHPVAGLTATHVLQALTATTYGFAQLDHGALGGLSDDDHTQYALLTGDTFTGNVTIDAAVPQLFLRESDAGTDERYWQFIANGAVFSIATVNDTLSTSVNFIKAIRTGVGNAVNEVMLRQSGDTFGATAIYARNRSGINGMLVHNEGLELVDFNALGSGGLTQGNFRWENRSTDVFDSNNPAWQIIPNVAAVDDRLEIQRDQMFFSTGASTFFRADHHIEGKFGSADATNGLTLTFSRAYSAVPYVVTSPSGGTHAVVSSKSTTATTCRALDSSHNGETRDINIVARDARASEIT